MHANAERSAQMRLQLAIENGDHVEAFQFSTWTRGDVEDLAAGLVPSVKRAEARAMLDFDDLLRRNADKPVRERKRA